MMLLLEERSAVTGQGGGGQIKKVRYSVGSWSVKAKAKAKGTARSEVCRGSTKYGSRSRGGGVVASTFEPFHSHLPIPPPGLTDQIRSRDLKLAPSNACRA